MKVCFLVNRVMLRGFFLLEWYASHQGRLTEAENHRKLKVLESESMS